MSGKYIDQQASCSFWPFFVILLFFPLIFVLCANRIADAVTLTSSRVLSLGYYSENNTFDPYARRFSGEQAVALAELFADCSWEPYRNLQVYAAGVLQGQSYFRPENDTDFDLILLNLYAGYYGESLRVSAGKQPFSLGRGLLYTDDTEGLKFRFAKGRFFFEACAASGPASGVMSDFAVGIIPGFLSELKFFCSRIPDKRGKTADIYNRYLPLQIDSGGDINTAGISWDFFAGGFYISGVAMRQFGDVDFFIGPLSRRMSLSGELIDLSCRYVIDSRFSVEGFFYYSSGDLHPFTGDLSVFVSPYPENPHAEIFFSGAIDGRDIDGGFALAGSTWAGVYAPGLLFSWSNEPTSTDIDIGVSFFFPESPGPIDSDFYGWETDASISWKPDSFLEIFLSGALFFHGDYAKEYLGSRPDPIFSFYAGASLFF